MAIKKAEMQSIEAHRDVCMRENLRLLEERERERACVRQLTACEELQEQQLPVKLPTEEPEEFQDAVEVQSSNGLKFAPPKADEPPSLCVGIWRPLRLMSHPLTQLAASFGKHGRRDHRSGVETSRVHSRCMR